MQPPKPLPTTHRDEFVGYLFERYHATLYFRAVALCRQYGEDANLADDLVQEVYLKVLTSFHFILAGYLKYGENYLTKMLRNGLNDRNRKAKSLKRVKDVFVQGLSMEIDQYHLCPDLYFRQLTNQLRQVLPEASLDIMTLYLQGYTYEEIGMQKDIPKGTVGTKIHRAKKILRQVLD